MCEQLLSDCKEGLELKSPWKFYSNPRQKVSCCEPRQTYVGRNLNCQVRLLVPVSRPLLTGGSSLGSSAKGLSQPCFLRTRGTGIEPLAVPMPRNHIATSPEERKSSA